MTQSEKAFIPTNPQGESSGEIKKRPFADIVPKNPIVIENQTNSQKENNVSNSEGTNVYSMKDFRDRKNQVPTTSIEQAVPRNQSQGVPGSESESSGLFSILKKALGSEIAEQLSGPVTEEAILEAKITVSPPHPHEQKPESPQERILEKVEKPLTVEEKIDTVKKVKYIEELIEESLPTIGSVSDERGTFTPDELKEMIHKAYAGKISLNDIPLTYGLRSKVLEFKKSITPEDSFLKENTSLEETVGEESPDIVPPVEEVEEDIQEGQNMAPKEDVPVATEKQNEKTEIPGAWKEARGQYKEYRDKVKEAQSKFTEASEKFENERHKTGVLSRLMATPKLDEAKKEMLQAQEEYDILLEGLRQKRQDRIKASLTHFKSEEEDEERFSSYIARHETILEHQIDNEVQLLENLRYQENEKGESRSRLVRGMKATWNWYRKLPLKKRLAVGVGVGAIFGAAGAATAGLGVAGVIAAGGMGATRRALGGFFGSIAALETKRFGDAVVEKMGASQLQKQHESFKEVKLGESRSERMAINKNVRRGKHVASALAAASAYTVGSNLAEAADASAQTVGDMFSTPKAFGADAPPTPPPTEDFSEVLKIYEAHDAQKVAPVEQVAVKPVEDFEIKDLFEGHLNEKYEVGEINPEANKVSFKNLEVVQTEVPLQPVVPIETNTPSIVEEVHTVSPNKIEVSGVYEAGSSVEKELQQFLKNNDWIKEKYPDLTDVERGKIAASLRIELMKDPTMAAKLHVHGGDWSKVFKNDTYEIHIDKYLIETKIERFHPVQSKIVTPLPNEVSPEIHSISLNPLEDATQVLSQENPTPAVEANTTNVADETGFQKFENKEAFENHLNEKYGSVHVSPEKITAPFKLPDEVVPQEATAPVVEVSPVVLEAEPIQPQIENPIKLGDEVVPQEEPTPTIVESVTLPEVESVQPVVPIETSTPSFVEEVHTVSPNKIEVSGVYEAGSSVEKELQQFLKNNDWIKEKYPDLTDVERGKIAASLRIELMKDPTMAAKLHVHGGDWSKVVARDAYTFEIDKATLSTEIEKIQKLSSKSVGSTINIQELTTTNEPFAPEKQNTFVEKEPAKVTTIYPDKQKVTFQKTESTQNIVPETRAKTLTQELVQAKKEMKIHEAVDYQGLNTRPSIEYLFKEKNIFDALMTSRRPLILSNWGPISHARMQDIFDGKGSISYTMKDGTTLTMGPQVEQLTRNIAEQLERNIRLNIKVPNIDTLFEEAQIQNSTLGEFITRVSQELEHRNTEATKNIVPVESKPQASVPTPESSSRGNVVEKIPLDKYQRPALLQQGENYTAKLAPIEVSGEVKNIVSQKYLSTHKGWNVGDPEMLYKNTDYPAFHKAVDTYRTDIAIDLSNRGEISIPKINIDWSEYKNMTPAEVLFQLEQHHKILSDENTSLLQKGKVISSETFLEN